MALYAKKDGVQHRSTGTLVKHNGVWERAPVIHRKSNGKWEQLLPAGNSLLHAGWKLNTATGDQYNRPTGTNKVIVDTQKFVLWVEEGSQHPVKAYPKTDFLVQNLHAPSQPTELRVLAVDKDSSFVAVGGRSGGKYFLVTYWLGDSSSTINAFIHTNLLSEFETHGVESAAPRQGGWIIANASQNFITFIDYTADNKSIMYNASHGLPFALTEPASIAWKGSSDIYKGVVSNSEGIHVVVIDFIRGHRGVNHFLAANIPEIAKGYQGISDFDTETVAAVVKGSDDVLRLFVYTYADNTGTTNGLDLGASDIRNLLVQGSDIYVVSEVGLHWSNDRGVHWDTWYDPREIGNIGGAAKQPVGIAGDTSIAHVMLQGGNILFK